MKPVSLVFVCCLALIGRAFAWHSTGHITVGRIAEKHLQHTGQQKIVDWVNGVLQPYTKVCGEDKWPFAECATWPDKVKEQGYWMMAGWHFTDQKYYKPGYVPPPEQTVIQSQNITWAIKNCAGNLISTSTDTQGKSDSLLMKSLSLRNLIHFLGDIHQPLHTTGRFSADLPNGDMGGNLFPIKHYSNPQWNNLHFIWDHLFDLGREINSPLTEEENTWLDKWAQDLMDLNPYDKLKPEIDQNWTPESWDDEGFQIVKTFVYTDIKENEDLPTEYQEEGRRIVKKRLALGGYRLANELKYIFSKQPPSVQNPDLPQNQKVEVVDMVIH